jgi:DNA-binding MarR family transcriptional regulator
MRQQALATMIGWEKSRLSHQLTRMQERGLIKRQSLDGQAVLIVLTTFGREKLVEALPIRAESVRRHLLSRLSQQQIDALVRMSNLLTDDE